MTLWFPFGGEISPVRRRALVWPREHGAWGILLVSLITGAAAGLSSPTNLPRLLWLALAATAAFSWRTPFENSLPSSPLRPRNCAEWRWVTAAMLVYALTCAFAVGMLIHEGALGLIWKPGVVAAGLFAVQAVIKRFSRASRLLSEIIGTFGLTIPAMAAWAVAAGRFDSQAVVLWLLNGLFATNQILYVQMRIQETRRFQHSLHSWDRVIFLAVEAFTVAVLIAAWRRSLMPGLALVAFLPVFTRGVVWSFRRTRQALQIHRLGKSELAHAILFGLLVIIAFRLFIP